MSLALYVYYRVDPARIDAARQTLAAAQAALRADWPGLTAEVMQRAEGMQRAEHSDAAAPPTWMEVYRQPDGLSDACLADLRRRLSDLPSGRLAQRHEELFTALDEGG